MPQKSNAETPKKSNAETPIPDALRFFNDLPAAGHVRQPVVEALFGISASTVWRRVRAGILKPHRLGKRTTTFNVGELRRALNAQEGT